MRITKKSRHYRDHSSGANHRRFELRGIDATSSGLKLRGCFTVSPVDFEMLDVAANPVPLSAPKWFKCYDVGEIQQDLDAGMSVAYLAAENENDGIDRFIAVYPDGRAFQWRQLNEKYQE